MFRSSSPNDVRFVAGAVVAGACLALVALVGVSKDAPTELMQFQRPGFQWRPQQGLRQQMVATHMPQGRRGIPQGRMGMQQRPQQGLRAVQQGRGGMEAKPLGLVQVGGKMNMLVDLEPRVPSWNPSDNLEYKQVKPPWMQPRGETIVSLVNSHTNATSKR